MKSLATAVFFLQVGRLVKDLVLVKWPERQSCQEQHTHVKLGLAWQMTGLQVTGMTVAQVFSQQLLVPSICLQQNVNTICAVQPLALRQINLLRTVCLPVIWFMIPTWI